jgi:hypothetical protein
MLSDTHICVSVSPSNVYNNLDNFVFFILGDSSASEFFVPKFQNTLSVPNVVLAGGITGMRLLGYLYG